MASFNRSGRTNGSHSATAKEDFINVVQDVVRPVRADSLLEVEGPVRGDSTPNDESLSSQHWSCPFENGFEHISLPPEGDLRPKTSAEPPAHQGRAKLRQGPARSVTAHNNHVRARVSRYGEIKNIQPSSPCITTKVVRKSVAAMIYPQSMEGLYIQCGIITNNDFQRSSREEINEIFEHWAGNNPVAAVHIVGLAKEWGLRPSIKGTMKLTDSGDEKQYRHTTDAHEFQKLYTTREKSISGEFASLGRKISKRFGQKPALGENITGKVSTSREEDSLVLSSVDRPTKVPELPISVQQLYADVAGLKLEDLSDEEKQQVMTDWTRLYPVSDSHLREVIELWAAEIKPVSIL